MINAGHWTNHYVHGLFFAMPTPDLRDVLAQTILYDTPAWVRVGLCAPVQRIREEAAVELVGTFLAALEQPPTQTDRNQLALPL